MGLIVNLKNKKYIVVHESDYKSEQVTCRYCGKDIKSGKNRFITNSGSHIGAPFGPFCSVAHARAAANASL